MKVCFSCGNKFETEGTVCEECKLKLRQKRNRPKTKSIIMKHLAKASCVNLISGNKVLLFLIPSLIFFLMFIKEYVLK